MGQFISRPKKCAAVLSILWMLQHRRHLWKHSRGIWPLRPLGQRILPFLNPRFCHLLQRQGHTITGSYDSMLNSDWLCISIPWYCHYWAVHTSAVSSNYMQLLATEYVQWVWWPAMWWILIESQSYKFPHCCDYLWHNIELQVITAIWNCLFGPRLHAAQAIGILV